MRVAGRLYKRDSGNIRGQFPAQFQRNEANFRVSFKGGEMKTVIYVV
jgi:hypothetical protein